MRPFEYATPTKKDQAVSLLGAEAAVLAGGTDLLALMKDDVVAPQRLVNIKAIPELEGISYNPRTGLRLGAAAKLQEVADHADVRRYYPLLAEAADDAASPQIRNRATLGGNLLQRPRCWYLRSKAHHCRRKGGAQCLAHEGDNRYHAVFANQGCAIVHPSTPATPLVAYGAEVEILDSGGRPRRLALEDFLLLPETGRHRENGLEAGEILTAVRLPPPAPTVRSAYLEIGERAAFDWPLAAAAAVLDVDDAGRCRQASLVLGAAAPVPWRARRAEAALAGVRIDDRSASAAAEAALEGAAPLRNVAREREGAYFEAGKS